MTRVGLHLRLTHSLVGVAHQAIALELPFFQSFLLQCHSTHYTWPTTQEEQAFRALCSNRFTPLFAHGSFWVNLSHTKYDNSRALGKEVACARRLGFSHLVVHAGSATGAVKNRLEGIDALARTINNVMHYERTITLVLENTAHKKLAIGSDIHDFALVREKLTHPEKVKFCIDTAHAHAYGYHIQTPEALDAFVRYIDTTLSLENVALIHLNDIQDAHGSCIDRHALIGTGHIGKQVLHAIVTHPLLKHIRIILEPPLAPLPEIIQSFNMVKQWDIGTFFDRPPIKSSTIDYYKA